MTPLLDHAVAMDFLRTWFTPEDWVALLVKCVRTGRVAQRIVPIELAGSERVRFWLEREQQRGYNVYVSVNGLRAKTASRRRHDVTHVRHVFLDADQRADEVLAAIRARHDVPPVSCVLHTSLGRAQMFWRVHEFTVDGVERLQRQLARELKTDVAATSACQLSRLPGSLNHKRRPAHRVTVTYYDRIALYTPDEFPAAGDIDGAPLANSPNTYARLRSPDGVERARRYIAVVPAAIAGQHGDAHTFAVCCRVVRGFGLSDEESIAALREWNRRCKPPWSDRDLRIKVRNARRYAREPIGGLLHESAQIGAESTLCR